MTSKDDDTLPLPGFSEELSVDATVDEDFIPASQPRSSEDSKIPKTSESSFNQSAEGLKCSITDSQIDDTLPTEAVMNHSAFDRDRSTDFIPDTETKKGQINYSNPEPSCRKKLPVFAAEETFKWESERTSRVPESPALDTRNISILNDTPIDVPPPKGEETVEKCEESITEIIVNDSAETVDLDATPIKMKTSESERLLEKLEISQCSSSYAGRCEETQIFDNSSVLLLDQPGGEESEKSSAGVTSEKLYLQETVEDAEAKPEPKGNGFGSVNSPPFAVAGDSEKVDVNGQAEDVGATHFPKEEVQMNSGSPEPNSSSIVIRKIDFKLTVSCFVTVNTKTNKVLQKIILNVNETPKPKPRPMYPEPVSDNTSDKSKRYSTSSSGSVYSDKMGPFALPKRISAVSDQTDSSEDEFGSLQVKERRALERVPWRNEYLLPLKMDDIMINSIENQELLKRPSIVPSPRKVKKKRCNDANYLKEIPESSTSEQTSNCNLASVDAQSGTTSTLRNSEEESEKKTPESSEPLLPEEEGNQNGGVETEEEEEEEEEKEKEKKEKKEEEEEKEKEKKEKKEEEEEKEKEKKEKQEEEGESPEKEEAGKGKVQEKESPEIEKEHDSRHLEEETKVEERSSIKLSEGLAVFARWTDKRYYPGVLCGSLKNERWEVKFDDGTRKPTRQDFLLPVEWLSVGSLVFALTDDKYESGQIVDIRKAEEVAYVVELDSENKTLTAKTSDLCLTDVMAGIVREKYKPLAVTPRAKPDIDFDNVLTGKRLREHRTPLRPPTTHQIGSSGPKKKSSSKPRREGPLESFKETPENEGTGGKRMRGLKTENGHLVEDKINSTDSPSGTEAAETPLRRSAKDARKKAKPRSLSYQEADEIRPTAAGGGKNRSKAWLTPDGTPIPGPSGIKLKKQKTKMGEKEGELEQQQQKKSPDKSKAGQSSEKNRRKRRLDDEVEDNTQKKSLKEEENRVKTRSRKG